MKTGGWYGVQQFLEQRAFFLVIARNPVDIAFLGSIIERDITGHCATTEYANFPHPLRADPAHSYIGNTAIGEAQAGIGDVFGFAQHW